MNITTRGKYGVKAIFELSLRKGQGPVPLRIIAESQSLPEQYLEQLMGSLRKAGLVKSVRGARGGYLLAGNPGDITVGQVLQVLEGSFLPDGPGSGGHGSKGHGPGRSDENRGGSALSGAAGDDDTAATTIDTVWNAIGRAVRGVVDSITFEDLRRTEMEKNRLHGYTYYI